jgi:FkbM family methyltransferase
MITRFVKNLAAKCGISVSRYPPHSSLEREVGSFLKQREINLVLDVGAFDGRYARWLRSLGYRKQIISFEPVASSYAKLEANLMGDPMWTGQPYGLSDEECAATMNTYGEKGDFNSLHRLKDNSHTALGIPDARTEQIALHRLDAVFSRLTRDIPSSLRVFLKMDTQGHDLSVFRGAAGILNLILGIQSEMAAICTYDGMPPMEEALAEYITAGYYPISFHRVNTLPNGWVAEFDVVLIRVEHDLLSYYLGAETSASRLRGRAGELHTSGD